MAVYHEMTVRSSSSGLLFECDACSRRLGVDRTRGGLVVIDRGDPEAFHRGSTGDIELREPAVSQA